MLHSQVEPFPSTHMPSWYGSGHGYQVALDQLDKFTIGVEQPDGAIGGIQVEQSRLWHQGR
jgi:hypothetical protein